jgi:hypothetical protein
MNQKRLNGATILRFMGREATTEGKARCQQVRRIEEAAFKNKHTQYVEPKQTLVLCNPGTKTEHFGIVT